MRDTLSVIKQNHVADTLKKLHSSFIVCRSSRGTLPSEWQPIDRAPSSASRKAASLLLPMNCPRSVQLAALCCREMASGHCNLVLMASMRACRMAGSNKAYIAACIYLLCTHAKGVSSGDDCGSSGITDNTRRTEVQVLRAHLLNCGTRPGSV